MQLKRARPTLGLTAIHLGKYYYHTEPVENAARKIQTRIPGGLLRLEDMLRKIPRPVLDLTEWIPLCVAIAPGNWPYSTEMLYLQSVRYEGSPKMIKYTVAHNQTFFNVADINKYIRTDVPEYGGVVLDYDSKLLTWTKPRQ